MTGEKLSVAIADTGAPDEPGDLGGGGPRVRWPTGFDPAERAGVVQLVTAVMQAGGAVGWIGVPTPGEIETWLTGVLGDVGRGRARLAVVADPELGVAGLGRWVRYDKPTLSGNADVQQVMVHPAARGRGLARMLVAALVADAAERGVETLTLDVRGNNQAAMVLYESFGFRVRGRLPDFVGVGDERWDQVLYALDLRDAGAPLRRHGARPIGPGASELR
jgi:ribosomal protein S18 acetylase RimI-like enzyme